MPLSAQAFEYPAWSVTPFVALLLCIALLPLFAEKWWHHNRNKAVIGIVFGLPTIAFCLFNRDYGNLGHTALEYMAFIALLGSLFVVSGGIEVRGSLSGTPLANTAMLALGAVLANIVGTTGASMLLIRPFLRANRKRTAKGHLVVFFIFIVANLGGLLTPIGDPPLFLGFLKGVPFTWTLRLWPQWALANGACLFLFTLIDQAKFSREGLHRNPHVPEDVQVRHRIEIRGWGNVVLLGGIVGAIVVGGKWAPGWFGHPGATAFHIVTLVAISALSWVTTSREVRQANEFTWHPFIEVAVLFAGIFAAMIPALGVLKQAGGANSGLTASWQYFWATGCLSAFLDNAPTYLAFFTMAQGESTADLLANRPFILAAISCGAVMFGAMTYIGNGPNFMVKAIAEHSGVKMPSFFGYIAWSVAILLPIFIAETLIFFMGR